MKTSTARCSRGERAKRERGIVLVAVLLLLLVVTVLGVAGMVTASMELKMAGNAQYQARAFAAAEHAIEQALRVAELDTRLSAVEPGRPVCAPHCVTPTGDGFDFETVYDGHAAATAAPDSGHSLGTGLQAHHFAVRGLGSSEHGARSEHTQGFYIVGPSEQ